MTAAPGAPPAEPPSPADEGARFDPGARELCSDGGCIGVIGDDGRCRVCGRSAGATDGADGADGVDGTDWADRAGDGDGTDAAGEEQATRGPAPGARAAPVRPDFDGRPDPDGPPDPDEPEEPAGDAGEGGDRVLCGDGNCVGLVGADGRCKVCGLAAGAGTE